MTQTTMSTTNGPYVNASQATNGFSRVYNNGPMNSTAMTNSYTNGFGMKHDALKLGEKA